MVFDLNRVFKLIPFVWGDYDGKQFRKSGFTQTRLPFLWVIFWWLFTIWNILRYLTLAVLPKSENGLEFYLGKS